jgi:hypothetical protein
MPPVTNISTRAADLKPVSAQSNLNQIIKGEPRKLPASNKLPSVSTPKNPSTQGNVTVDARRTANGGSSATVTIKEPRSGAQVTTAISQGASRPGERTTSSGTVNLQTPLPLGARGNATVDLGTNRVTSATISRTATLGPATATGTYNAQTGRVDTTIGVSYGNGGTAGVSLPSGKPVTVTTTTPPVTVGRTPVTATGSYTPATGANSIGINVGGVGINATTDARKPTVIGVSGEVARINGTPVNAGVTVNTGTGEVRAEVKPVRFEF